MGKWKIPVIVLSAVAALTVATVGGAAALASSARQLQTQLHGVYTTMCSNVRQANVTVTENGENVGTYDLEQLGVLDDTLLAVDNSFHPYSRMTQEEFDEEPLAGRLKWRIWGDSAPESVAVQAESLDMSAVMKDLDAVTRQAPVDAYIDYADGSFFVRDEVPGTKLEDDAVRTAVLSTVQTLAADTSAAGKATVELTEHDCYVQPKVTAENGTFDFAERLTDAAKSMTVTVNFQGKKEVLTGASVEKLLSVTDKGQVLVDEDALSELTAQWHKTYRNDGVPYLFNAQVGGIKPIDFLPVDYELNREATAEALKQTLLQLENAEIEAVWYCWRKGEAFAIKDNYVEIDIPNQKMTYVKDGEVLVSTDIVTGATWGYPTPPGFYKVENKDTNCWLSGIDYNVHVDYWIGFIGFEIGIHDADWRTKFGGTNYVKNGSHGCVNTPKEATALIFDNIEVGVPVLVYGK
ncbi:MAG: L,D-transpeptidase [Oscillospiraceae bacterium]|nr:L,D-transpeptidase [Oscillospiraceae bacterium]